MGPVPSLAPPGGAAGRAGGDDDDEDDEELQAMLAQSRRDSHAGRPAGAEEADFSRALEATQRALGDVPSDGADQEQIDAVLATMLQNQMLKQQLQQDRGFTDMLSGEGSNSGRPLGAPAVSPTAGARILFFCN